MSTQREVSTQRGRYLGAGEYSPPLLTLGGSLQNITVSKKAVCILQECFLV